MLEAWSAMPFVLRQAGEAVLGSQGCNDPRARQANLDVSIGHLAATGQDTKCSFAVPK